MSHGKQFTLYTHNVGPNGWKVGLVLTELGLSYESIYLDFSKGEHKAPAFTKYSPNGRIPAIIDHLNNGFVVWESNAIITYLVEKYDEDNKISVSGADEKIIQLQWLMFQASGQGPYYGQGTWFKYFHAEVPSAVDRYAKEAIRVLGVLESVLSKQEWLVGGKPTIVDLSFIPWNKVAFELLLDDYEGFDLKKDFPAVAAWHEKLLARPAVIAVYAVKDSL